MASWLLHFCHFEKAGLGNILLLYHYLGVKPYLASIFDMVVLQWAINVFLFSPGFKGYITGELTVQLVLILVFTHLVITATLLMTVKRSHSHSYSNVGISILRYLVKNSVISSGGAGQKMTENHLSNIQVWKNVYIYGESEISDTWILISLLSLHERASSHPDWPWGERLSMIRGWSPHTALQAVWICWYKIG